jgi:hypothetical protein
MPVVSAVAYAGAEYERILPVVGFED